MATRNTFQDDSSSAHATSEDVFGLQELLDQATQTLTAGDVSLARHLVEMAVLLYQEPRLDPILEGLILREKQVQENVHNANAKSGVIGTSKPVSETTVSGHTNYWFVGLTRVSPNDGVRWNFSGRAF